MEKSDHDLLIEINRDMQWMKENYIGHCKEDSAFQKIIESKTDAAHKRIDGLTVSGVLSLILLAISIFLTHK